MNKSIFGYIFEHSRKQQTFVLALTLIYFPILYLSFELPKIIVNDALMTYEMRFPIDILGVSISQLQYLFALCLIFLGLVLLAGGLRYFLSVYKGVLGEIMLRRLRYDLYRSVLRFPLTQFQRVTGGEIVTMTTAEVEPLGRYMGTAVANPALLGGTLITAMVFLFAQDMWLGIAAIALFPLQAYLVPKLQRKMNEVSRQRLQNLRLFAGHVNETVSGVREIHSHDTSQYELSKSSNILGRLFRIRRELYKRGNVIIFMNTFFTQLTPFLFYSIGGYLVIMGDLTLGALIAVIAAYRETATPWNELLEYYQALEDNRVKYSALVEHFVTEDMRPLPEPGEAPSSPPLPELLSAHAVSLLRGDTRVLDHVSFECTAGEHLAILGPGGSGKAELSQLLCGLRKPTSGAIKLGERNLTDCSDDEIGRVIAYVDQDSHVFSGSWRDNLYYGLKHRPVRPCENHGYSESERAQWEEEARLAGNTTADFQADWIDYASIGLDGPEELRREACRVIRLVCLESDVYQLGLRQGFDPDQSPDLAARLLQARRILCRKITESDCGKGVEFFDQESFNDNATVAENLLFGRPTGTVFDVYHLGTNDYVLGILQRVGLLDLLLEIGRTAAVATLETFRDIGEDEERLNRFSLIDRESIPEYEALLRRVDDAGLESIGANDRSRLLALVFTMAPAHQRLGLITRVVKQKILDARVIFARELPEGMAAHVDFFDPDRVNANVSIRCNLLYGRLRRSREKVRQTVGRLIDDAVEDAGLRESIINLGMEANVGTGGAQLSSAQRQKLALARCLVKRPRVLIVNEGLTALDVGEQETIRRRVLADAEGRVVVWIDRDGMDPTGFARVLQIRDGKLIGKADGTTASPAVADEDGENSLDAQVRQLQSVPLLQDVEPATLRLMAYTGERVEVAAGSVIYSADDPPEAAYLLLEGRAEIRASAESGAMVDVGSGSLIGEIALLAESARSTTARATSPLVALRLDRQLFSDLIDQDRGLARVLMRRLATRLRECPIAGLAPVV